MCIKEKQNISSQSFFRNLSHFYTPFWYLCPWTSWSVVPGWLFCLMRCGYWYWIILVLYWCLFIKPARLSFINATTDYSLTALVKKLFGMHLKVFYVSLCTYGVHASRKYNAQEQSECRTLKNWSGNKQSKHLNCIM